MSILTLLEQLDSEEAREFRHEVREFIREHLPPWYVNKHIESEEMWRIGRNFAHALAQRGWLVMGWPREYGGGEAPIWRQVVLAEELAANHAPQDGMAIGVGMVGPLIMEFGTEEQKQHLPGIASGKVVWSECFSEPNSGSDLASLRTAATPNEAGWKLSGEKVWITHGYLADWALVLARTEPGATAHKGISAFLVDMRLPGVSARRIPCAVAGEYLSEVLFDDVPLPVSALLGERGKGFYYAMHSVGIERAIALKYSISRRLLRGLSGVAARQGANGNLSAENCNLVEIGRLECYIEAARLLGYDVLASVIAGHQDERISMAFVWDTKVQQQLQNFAMDLLGLDGRITSEANLESLAGLIASRDSAIIHATVAPGTMEIQQMIVATRYLGLPR